MNFETLVPIILKITTILSLIALIVYGIIYLGQSHKTVVSSEIITALKKSDINIDDISRLSPENAKALIRSHTSISKEILKSGIHSEIKSRTKIILGASTFLFLLGSVGLIIFATSKKNQENYIYNGFVFDKLSNIPLQNVKIAIEKRPDIEPVLSDSRGYFKIRIKQDEFKIIVELEKYSKITLSKTLSETNGFDTIFLLSVSKSTIFEPTKLEPNILASKDKKVAQQVKEKYNSDKLIEISIQLNNSTEGFASIKLNGKDANISANSTALNPRIWLVSSTSLQNIEIVTKEGDTCILKRVFDKKMVSTFPIRFIPNCKN